MSNLKKMSNLKNDAGVIPSIFDRPIKSIVKSPESEFIK
jgi:hypothetical protein